MGDAGDGNDEKVLTSTGFESLCGHILSQFNSFAMKYAITVPSKSPRKSFDHKEAVNFVTEAMCDLFGGCTALAGFGSWKDADGKLIQGEVTVIYSFGTAGEKSTEKLRGIAAQLCDFAGQDCVLIEHGFEAELIEVTAKVEEDPLGIVFSKNDAGNHVATFRSPISSENSFSRQQLADEVESTMEFFEDDLGGGVIEWDIEELETTEHIGIQVENGVLEGYDGVFYLPKQAIALLEKVGIVVPDEYKEEGEGLA